MRAIVLGIAATLATGLSLAPASAMPVVGGGTVAPAAAIEQAQYVTRRVVRRGPRCTVQVIRTRGPFGRVVRRGPRCTVQVIRTRGPFGRVVVRKVRRCF